MKELRQKLQTLLSNSIGDRSASDYKKLITFIDASISQAFKLPEEEKNSFLISSVLNIRDYLQSEIVTMTYNVVRKKANESITNSKSR